MNSLYNMPQDLQEFIKSLEIGYMFYHFLMEPNGDNEDAMVAFIIKDNQYRLNKLKPIVAVNFISVGVDIKNVLVIDVLMKFPDITDTIYECFINAKNNESGASAIRSLATKNKYHIIFVNEYNEIFRQVKFDNSGKENFKQFEYRLSEWLSWSMEEFDTAKEEFLEKYPDAFELFENVSKK